MDESSDGRFGRYLAATVAVFIPLAAVFVVCLLYAGRPFGASETPAGLAAIQAARPDTVVLPFDLRHNGAFKVSRVEQLRPEVMYFSSSRAGEMRADMFKPYSFYNMSFTAWTTGQLADIFERATRDVRPRIAIIELDYFLFTDNWEQSYVPSRAMIFDRPVRYVTSSLGNFISAAAQNTATFRSYLEAPNRFVGPQAILQQEGFRADGSYVYSSRHIEYSREHELNADFLVNAMPGAPNMSERQKAQVVRLSEIARQRGVKLVAVQLPFIREGVDYLDNRESYRYYSGVWRDFESDATRHWLAGLGIEFFDLARSSIGSDKANFIDAYHPSEIGMRRAMMELLQRPGFRADFPSIDASQIERSIVSAAPEPDSPREN
jgi:hypothetical protein